MIQTHLLPGSEKIRRLKNKVCSVEIDLWGGAITSFILRGSRINPLNFRFTLEQMPLNNRDGAPYRGHFLCLGRWGRPSEGEIKAGIPDHGQFANIVWNEKRKDSRQLDIDCFSELEGLHLKRYIELDSNAAVFVVTEEVCNTTALGRLYNMVQHPTLASPFLDRFTIINANADLGFDSSFSHDPERYISKWPYGLCKDMATLDLSKTENPYSSVFSYIINKESKLGWVIAFSPTSNTLIGYMWDRKDYAWLNLWQDWHEGKIRYRGIEFGTTGIHKPFREIINDSNWKIFDERACDYIDAGEIRSRKYISFLCKTPPGFQGVTEVRIAGNSISLDDHISSKKIKINTKFNFDQFLS